MLLTCASPKGPPASNPRWCAAWPAHAPLPLEPPSAPPPCVVKMPKEQGQRCPPESYQGTGVASPQRHMQAMQHSGILAFWHSGILDHGLSGGIAQRPPQQQQPAHLLPKAVAALLLQLLLLPGRVVVLLVLLLVLQRRRRR